MEPEPGARFFGSIAPLPTPFTEDAASVDTAAIERLVEFHVVHGTHGLSSTGTTGEPTSLSLEEQKLVIRTVVEASSGRLPVLAGTGSNWTEESVALSQYARDVGADGVLAVAPYHVKPSQQGLFEHYTRIARAVEELPVMLYNIPGRASVNIEPETQRRIREACGNVFGIKEANPDFLQVSWDLKVVGRDFRVFSGIETLSFPMLAVGGSGHVSATANVAPRDVADLYELTRDGRWEEARNLHFKMLDLNHALFVETNPGPLKFLLGEMGLIEPTLRLPLVVPSEANQKKIVQAARAYGIL